MKVRAAWLLALVVALGLPGVLEATGRENESLQRTKDGPATPNPAASEEVAWECVPSYWLGYWVWAWQPCPWIDRTYVQAAIGAVASASDDVLERASP